MRWTKRKTTWAALALVLVVAAVAWRSRAQQLDPMEED